MGDLLSALDADDGLGNIPKTDFARLRVVASDDPCRCQFQFPNGQQCNYSQLQGYKTCERHTNAGRKGRYNLTVHAARIKELTEDSNFRDMREEVAVLRFTLEQIVNAAKEPFDIIVHESRITNLISQIQKSVVTIHKLDAAMGHLLERQAILTFIDETCQIVSNHVEDPEKLKKIATEIGEALERATAASASASVQRTDQKGAL